MKKNIKAVTIGDLNGIGIKLLINLYKFKRKKIKKFFLISNFKIFEKFLKKNKIKLNIAKISDPNEAIKIYNNFFPIYNISASNDILNTYNSIKEGYLLTKNNFCDSLITLPINKEKIIKNIDNGFIGQTEFFQKLDKKKYSNMIFYSKSIIVATLTTHIPIKNINFFFKKNKNFYKKIISINNLIKKDFKISKPKLVIAGLNPHAGENGVIGNEEKKYIEPVIKELIKNKINIHGPLSPDTLFNDVNRKKYDCFICIYHDQALIPFKLISKFTGVNYTGSLDIIRTSPSHGTGYDIKNISKANDKSLINAFILADKIYQNRKKN